MRHLDTVYASWFALFLALLLWVGVGYFSRAISVEESERALRKADVENASAAQTTALKLHALARETKPMREKLSDITRADAIEILHEIEGVARDSGIPIGIRQALTTSAPDSASSLRSAAFVVETEGTFSEVIHAVALLDTLPAPSLINQLQLEKVSATAEAARKSGSRWRAVVHMNFLTTAEISS